MTDRQAGRALIVEDEILVAMQLEDLLTAMGHQVIGSAARMALELARDAEIDFVVLDINVGGVQSFPVADILRELDHNDMINELMPSDQNGTY